MERIQNKAYREWAGGYGMIEVIDRVLLNKCSSIAMTAVVTFEQRKKFNHYIALPNIYF